MNTIDKLVVSRPLYISDDHCGYCHQKKDRSQAVSLNSWFLSSPNEFYPQSTTIGFQIESMTVSQYDQLIQMGYRRSGRFVYKPDLLRSCCRMFTIRTCWDQFIPQKEHRRDVNKFNASLQCQTHLKGKYDMEKELAKPLEEGKLETKFEKSEFSEEKYGLFVKYQREIHDDKDTSKKGFTRFLCQTPFNSKGKIKDGEVESFGSIHQCYYIDSKLIAVAFLDLLPSGISSVYFIYDPDFKQLALGKVSGLKEMLLCKDLGLDWYYLGYYIEDCPKMSYKRKFGGQILNPLDGEFYNYGTLQKCMVKGRLFSWNGDGDVSERKFGADGSAFREAEECAERLRVNLGVDYPTDRWPAMANQEDDGDIFDLPSVLPGCLSLTDVVDDGEKLEQSVLILYQGSKSMKVNFPLLTPRFQRTVIDLVRLLGWSLFEECVVCL